MLRRVRFTLTALYALFGVLLIVVMGLGSFFLLTAYFSASTDVMLRWSIAAQFKAAGVRLPADLAAADRSWLAPSQSHKSGDENDDHEEDRLVNPALAPVFVMALRSDGRSIQTGGTTPIVPDAAALNDALRNGSDVRTVLSTSGERVRLITYALPGRNGQVALQAGRFLGDQDQLLASLVAGLLVIGCLSSVFLGSASWWLSGRSIRPAERAWAQQQTFVANASHELRTPLTLIRATAEVAKRGTQDPETRALMDDVLDECDHMSRLTEDLLLLSRLDAGELKLHRAAIPVADLLDELERRMGRVAAGHGIRLTVDSPSLMVLGDPTRIRQVLLILLDNAIRHTPAGGLVQVTARRQARNIVFSVHDSGEGIATEHIDRVFDRFYRVDTARGSGKGTGLGLAVAKSLVEAQSGSIQIKSAVGAGTEVSFSLPAAEQPDTVASPSTGSAITGAAPSQRV